MEKKAEERERDKANNLFTSAVLGLVIHTTIQYKQELHS